MAGVATTTAGLRSRLGRGGIQIVKSNGGDVFFARGRRGSEAGADVVGENGVPDVVSAFQTSYPPPHTGGRPRTSRMRRHPQRQLVRSQENARRLLASINRLESGAANVHDLVE